MFAEPVLPERQQPPPSLATGLPSNNPFRNRAISPIRTPSKGADHSQADDRSVSRNPFLKSFEIEFNKEASRGLVDTTANKKEPPKANLGSTAAEEFFNNLRVQDDARKRTLPRPSNLRSDTDPRAGHRPSRSDEGRERMGGGPRGPLRPRAPPGPRPPPLGSPERRENRRPRRNSESSMVDKGSLDPNEECRRRERRRERDERAKDGKPSQRRVRKPQGLDLIDKLDVTGIYGPSMIHHDGPYDAVQPHRNRKKDQRSPMHAFPANSANNSLGGSGPINSKIDLDRIHGRGAEGFTDFGGAETVWKKAQHETEFSVKGREDILHGEQSHGLGTSTFLEGAPASRKAIEEECEKQRAMAENGLGRKKSIAQRFRGMSQPRRNMDGPRITSPESRYAQTGPQSVGPIAQTKANERNPFFTDDYDKAYEAKGAAAFHTSETDAKEAPSSPPRDPLTRSVTADSMGSPTSDGKPSTKFLNRVRSLKGGRRRPT